MTAGKHSGVADRLGKIFHTTDGASKVRQSFGLRALAIFYLISNSNEEVLLLRLETIKKPAGDFVSEAWNITPTLHLKAV